MMLDKDGINDLVEQLSQLADEADSALCATRLKLPDSIHVQGLKATLLNLRKQLVAIVGKFEPDAEWYFAYEEEEG